MQAVGPDLTALIVHTLGAFLLSFVFLFLWRQSRIVSFASWSLAWLLEGLALVFAGFYFSSRQTAWLTSYAFLEYAYALSAAAAARLEDLNMARNWPGTLRALTAFPLFLAAVYLLGLQTTFEGFHALHALVLAAIYVYGATRLRGDASTGTVWFRFSLVALSAASLSYAVVFFLIHNRGNAGGWPAYLRYYNLYDLALQLLLAFSAMAMWIQNQRYRILALSAELEDMRRDGLRGLDLDRLTGLLNQAALERRLESPEPFKGVVAVCDMDNFKSINDRFGHLVGDEILRNVGHLLRLSIRQEDQAFRWGGDEFVILFRNQNRIIAMSRMRALADRLSSFQVRGFGAMPISFSWGTAELHGGPLRAALDQADQEMYSSKRQRTP